MDDVTATAWLDQEDAHVSMTIRRHGWFIQYVMGDPAAHLTGFAYTIGLFGLGHPELVVTGLDDRSSAALLNEVAERVRRGDNLVPGQLLTFGDWPHRVTVEELPNPGAVLLGANQHYARPSEASVPALLMTYDDKWGRFPWEDGYAVPAWVQPRPGTFAA